MTHLPHSVLLLRTHVHMHGGLTYITLRPSVCDWTKILTRKCLWITFPIRNNTPFLSVFVNEIICIKTSRLVHRKNGIYTHSQKERNFSSWIFTGAQVQGHVTLDHGKSAYNPRFTGIHSSPKERQLPNCCVSFEKECIYSHAHISVYEQAQTDGTNSNIPELLIPEVIKICSVQK